MISEKDLLKMKSQQEEAMDKVCYVQSLSRTSDSAGGWTEAWQTISTTKCGISTPSPTHYEEVGGKIIDMNTVVIRLPASVSVTEQNRLQVDGVQYQVKNVLRRSHQTAKLAVCSPV